MEGLVIGWRELLLLVIAVLAVYAAEMLLLLRHGAGGRLGWRRGASLPHEAHVRELALQLEQLRQQVRHLEAELGQLRQAAVTPERDTPYGQAIAMARRGLSAPEVAAGCGISRGEAELIIALYRHSGTGA